MAGLGALRWSSRERILKAIDLEEPDVVPLFDFLYENKSLENILGRSIEKVTPEVIVEGHRALGLDMICVGTGAREGWENKTLAPEITIDEWGIKYKITDDFRALPWFLEGPIKCEEDYERYEIPDPHAPGRLKTVSSVRELAADAAVSATFQIGGPFTAVSFLVGFDRILEYLQRPPRHIRELFEKVTWFCEEIGKLCIDSGVEIMFINDDLGDNHGPVCSPRLFRERILPHLERLTRAFKRRGARVLLHCDGNINLILNDLVDIGIDGLHPLERKSSMDIAQIKREYGDRVCLIGNVDGSMLLPFGSYEEIERQVRECIGAAAPGGGYIFASDHSIHPGIPGERARFLFETAQRLRRYPMTF